MRKRVKKKRDEEDLVEQLQREIRELKSINRSLSKRLKKVDKGYKKSYEEDKEENEKISKRKTCQECERGEIFEVIVAGRLFQRCEVCNWRSKAKRI